MPRGAVRPTVASHWTLLVADGLEAVGFRAGAWLRARGYPRARLQAHGERVPWELAVRLWRAAARATRDPLLGLHVAARVPNRAPHAFTFMAMSAATLKQAFETFVRCQDVVATVRAMTLEHRGDHWAVGLLGAGDPPLDARASRRAGRRWPASPGASGSRPGPSSGT